MTFQPAPGIMQAIMEFSSNGQIMQNRLHVRSTETIGVGACEDLGATIKSWWNDELKAFVGTGTTLDAVKVRDLGEEFGAFFNYTAGLPLAGTLASPNMPGNVTAVVSWGSGLTGRSTRGRTYHVGLTESQCLTNLLESAAQSALGAAYAELPGILRAFSAEWTLVVLSRTHNHVPLAEAIGYEIVSSAVDQLLDSQRRRLSGRGQ